MIRKIFYKWSRIFIHIYAYYMYKCSVTQWCSTLCNRMDRNPPGSSVHGIFQARILEWDVVLFSRGSSQPRDQTQVFCFAGRFFTIWAMMLSSGWDKMAQQCHSHIPIKRKRANGKPGSCTHHFKLCSVGQILPMCPFLAAREAGQCRLYSTWPGSWF